METANAVTSSAGSPGAVPVILASTVPTSLLSYNISLNFSSLFAMFPTTDFFARIRKGIYRNGMDQMQFPSPSAGIGTDWSLETPHQPGLEATAKAASMDFFPGPWAFFTSWYMLGLFLMAVLLHRIQNVIIPSRMPRHRRQRHAYRFGPNFAPRYQVLRWLCGLVLPLDFSRTITRLILHIPSAYFLSRMLLIWLLLVLQTSEILPSWSALGWLNNMVRWGSAKDMSDVCWHTFCAVCGAFLVEGIVKALDGMGSGFPIGSANPNTSPFNLVGYAFLLHVYSSPQTHSYKPLDDGPSRPDKHVLITIAIPLLQLTIFHLLSVSKRLSTHRLIPTALSSMLSLLHFHGTLFSHYKRARWGSTPAPTPTSGRTSAHVTYPLLNYIPNFFETMLICTILLTLFLNALAQLLVRGRIDRIFSQLGIGYGSSLHDDESGSHGFFASLPLDEDFGVLLLRVGIASLEATGLKGWGNEVAPIPLPVKARKGRRSLGSSTATPTHGTVRMGRTGAGDVQYGLADSASLASSFSLNPQRMLVDNVHADQSEIRRRQKGKTMQMQYRRGFNNEVRTVDLGVVEATGRGRSAQRWHWLRELYAYLTTLWGVLKGLVIFLLERARGRVRISESVRKGPGGRDHVVREEGEQQSANVGSLKDQAWRARILYERFLRGEDISDDDDEVEEENSTLSESDDIHAESDEDNDEWEDENDGEAEVITLFTDFLRNASTSAVGRGGGDREMVLAHLVHEARGGSSGPLTRRRWNALVQQESVVREHRPRDESYLYEEDGEDETWDASSGRRSIFDQDPDTEKGFMDACVICTNEKRDIICWPCRCLAMCDNCREALASKSSPTKHSCPCCRQSVEGYSKIYIP